MAGGMINTGTMAIKVAAIPACVFCMASRENDTPRNGPKTDPRVILFIAEVFLIASPTFLHRFMIKNKMVNPAIPANTRIWEEANAS